MVAWAVSSMLLLTKGDTLVWYATRSAGLRSAEESLQDSDAPLPPNPPLMPFVAPRSGSLSARARNRARTEPVPLGEAACSARRAAAGGGTWARDVRAPS